METDVLIIGGGPAGSSAATYLAKSGLRVVVLEKSKFPRYHIGESLLPSAIEFFKLLGVHEKVKARQYTPKPGAYFQWGADPTPWWIRFGDLQEQRVTTYQVERADFDHVLLNHARDCGAEVIERACVDEFEFAADGRPTAAHYMYKGTNHTIRFRHLIDASGRGGILNHKTLQRRVYHETFRNIALWGYWKDTNPLPEGMAGSVTSAAFGDGWIWAIPLANGLLSVGVVTHLDHYTKMAKEVGKLQFYQDCLARSSVVSGLVKGASLTTELRQEQDYSYTSTAFSGPGFFACGDAACFIDPILSSGVHLAMLSALLASAVINSIEQKILTEEEGRNFYDNLYQRSFLRFMTFISGFYEQNSQQSDYFARAAKLVDRESDHKDLKMAFISLITGVQDMADLKGNIGEEIQQNVARLVADNIAMRKDRSKVVDIRTSKKAKDNGAFFNAIEGFSAILEEYNGYQLQLHPDIRVVKTTNQAKASA